MVLRLIWPSRFSRTTNSGTRSTEGIFFDRTRHSSRRRAASMRRLVLLFWIVWLAGDHVGVEAELPLAPDGEGVDRLLALEVGELRVDDAAVLEVDAGPAASPR